MLALAKGTEATSETGLQEQGGKLDPRGARWRLPCCVFLHLFVLQINERRYNASIRKREHKRPSRQGYKNRGASWTTGVSSGGSLAAPSFIFSFFKLMREDTTLVLAKSTEATSETGLQEHRGKLDPRCVRWRLPSCVFLHLLLFQFHEKRYNAGICEKYRSDLRDRSTGTGGQVGPHGCQVKAPELRLPSSSRLAK